MSRRDPKVRLLHMQDYARRAVDMVQGKRREDLDSNEMLRLALTHLVELVGEAASQVPTDVQAQYPQIPWPEVIGMRHRLIHGYDLVDYDVLWDTILINLPRLIATLDEILKEEA